MSEIINVSFEDFINQLPASGLFEENLFVTKIICPQAGQRLLSPVRLNAILLFFCKNGELSISVDYQEYLLNKNKALWISNLHIIDSIIISEDLEGYAIIMSHQIAKSIFNEIRGINSLIGDEPRIPSPMAELDDAEMQCLSEVAERIIRIQGDTSHVFQSYIIRNEVSNLFFEILNIRIKRNKNQTSLDKSGYKEEVARKFILLLLENSKERHEVSFYAEKLCMTGDNLSRIMKAFSGKTAIKCINDVLVADAKILLRRPNSTVQRVADELHFGDQSSFGKFFRKHTGMTPREYKSRINS